MVKLNHNWFFVLIVIVVIIAGLLVVVFSGAQVTGQLAQKWGGTVYKGCTYLSNDKYGECTTTERQNSAHCEDRDGTLMPETLVYKRLSDRRTIDRYYRPCSNVRFNG